jgi:hypothetical protein
MTWEELRTTLLSMRSSEISAGAPHFMTIPESWYDGGRWRCPNGHISTMILRCESGIRDRCLGCHQPVMITFPQDEEGELAMAPNTPIISIDNVVARSKKHSSFEIPEKEARNGLRVGDHAKLIFIERIRAQEEGERMWVKVTKVRSPGKYEGVIDNDPVVVNMTYGDPIVFYAEHVCDIERA